MSEHSKRVNWRTGLTTSLVHFLGIFFLLFYALGQRSLSGSEDRWGEIARNMLQQRDWFHPVINGEVYFDKPLLSYWLIVIAAHITSGLDEFAVRLPGALSGLLAMFCTHRIALELFNRRVAWLSVCLIATSYGFLFWTHTASAELSNLALIMAAVAWFVHRRERTDFASYLVFYLLCAIGCQLKGLTAIVVPTLAILPYVMRHQRWKEHINVAHILALGLSIGVFFLPYLGAESHPLPIGIAAQNNHLSGIELLIRENFVRFFEPFDHRDPFYSYLYEVPRILFPWMFLFLAALTHYGKRYRQLEESRVWLLNVIIAIFLFFTFSGSRRWYYILPIMPFCMILLSAYLFEDGELKWRRLATRATSVVMLVGAGLLFLVPVAVNFYSSGTPVPRDFLAGSAIAATSVIVLLLFRRFNFEALIPAGRDLPVLMPVLLIVAALEMVAVFGFMLPGADSYRQLRPFTLSLLNQVRHDERVTFFKSANTAMAFYLNANSPIVVVNSISDLPPSSTGWVVISEQADLGSLFEAFPNLRNEPPMLKESNPFKKALLDTSGLVAYRLH